MLEPRSAREELLNRASGSAVRSTRVRASVCIGSRDGSESRACSALSFADCLDLDTGGDGIVSRFRLNFGFGGSMGPSEDDSAEGDGSPSSNIGEMGK